VNTVYIVMFKQGEAACSSDDDVIEAVCDSEKTANQYIEMKAEEYAEEEGYEKDDSEVKGYKDYYYVSEYGVYTASDFVKPKPKKRERATKRDTDPLSVERMRRSKRKIVKVKGRMFLIAGTRYSDGYRQNSGWASERGYLVFSNKSAADKYFKEHEEELNDSHYRIRVEEYGDHKGDEHLIGDAAVVDKDGYLWASDNGQYLVFSDYRGDAMACAFKLAKGDKDGCSFVRIKALEFEDGLGEGYKQTVWVDAFHPDDKSQWRDYQGNKIEQSGA